MLKTITIIGLVVLIGLAGLFAISRDGSAATQTIGTLFNAAFAEGGVDVARDIAYGRHPRQRLDIYRPEGTLDGAGRRKPDQGPVAMFYYGGSWRDGDRALYRFVGTALALRGVTTIIADYRLFPEVRFPEFVNDAAQAYAWTWRNVAASNGTARPLFVVGHSAGAHMAAMLALDKRYLAGVGPDVPPPAGLVGLAGPYAFDPTTWPSTKDVFRGTTDADTARPVTFVHQGAPPALLMHGLDDDTVRLWNMQTLSKALTDAGVEVEALELGGIGHLGIVTAIAPPLRWRAPVLEKIMAFIEARTPKS